MYQYKSLTDTIAAISTPVGQGGIGIVRLSGDRAVAVADKMFAAKNGKPLSGAKSFTVHYGRIVERDDNGKVVADIDEVLVTVMRAPKSYTCEDVVEISCHGGAVVLKSILALAVDSGARLAEPGEFTKRAFLNGRIDLTQAEAVQDIIQAKTESFMRFSQNQLKGELSTELESIRESLFAVYTQIEAIVNFPEDETGAKGLKEIRSQVEAAEKKVAVLLASSGQGKIYRDGIKIVICGKPNVGKSSLLNALLKQPRAIVSEIAGTTRDTIEEAAQIRGIPVRLVDTAGILEPRDLIEKEAIQRSRMSMASADLILYILDAQEGLTKDDEALMESVRGRNAVIIVNKCDLPNRFDEAGIRKSFQEQKVIKISVLQKTGFESLENAIVESVWHGGGEAHGILVSNARHIASLKSCLADLQESVRILNEKLSPEFLSEEIKSAVNALDNITGRNIDNDLLETIFSAFCIGK